MSAWACPFDRTCLGMCEWTGCPGQYFNGQEADSASASEQAVEPPPPKRPHLNELLQVSNQPLPLPAATSRFGFSNEKELEQLAQGLVPKATSNNTQWALKNFSQWKVQRNLK